VTLLPARLVVPRLPRRLVEHLRARGDAPALLGGSVPGGGLTYAGLADLVAERAATYAGERRLVLLEGRSTLAGVVEYLGALAADQVVVLAGPTSVDRLAATYDPDVVVNAAGRRDVRPATRHELHPELTLLLSTSGSTGSPKLVRLSAESLLANARAIVGSLGIRDSDVVATTLPLHYCYGLSVLHSHLLAGAALLLTEDSVVDERFWADVVAHQVTTFPGVPHTYELLERTGFAARDLPSLRYLTQAGGRLRPDKVRAFAELGQRKGFDFVVMYGQTEATARMAVLPADLALTAPEAIGRPVPGGAFALRPVDGCEPGTGELVFTGANVMLGYAESAADLALGRTVTELRTGDLGRLRPDGLWEVTGRLGRMAKVLGHRLDLDRVERLLAERGAVVAAADGGDRLVLGVADGARPVDAGSLRRLVRDEIGLPGTAVDVVVVPDLPRLPSGKVDYAALVRATEARTTTGGDAAARATADAVATLYATALGLPVGPDDSFVSLGGDSLSYVEVSLRLEALIGRLPGDWPTQTVARLAGGTDTDRPRGRGRLVETNVVLRALAIVSIVASHANLVSLLGGAHLLLAVAGFNMARFQLTDADRTERARHLGRSALRVAVPSVLVIATVSMWTEGLGWRQALLLNGLTSRHWAEPGWYYWFVEAIVYLFVVLAALAAVPALDRLERAHPFWLPFGLALAALVTRYGLVGLPGDNVHRVHVVFWIFAIGWAAARATARRHRVLLSALTVLTLPGFFDQAARDAYVALGLLALIWLPGLRLPGWLARTAGVLAAASLWIYLLHWQVYPHLEDSLPWLATLLSLLVGVVAAWLAARVTRATSRSGNP
jgi:acyl-coenzyme A synthetase/AMP-(fatty) acid ligase